jgi:carotenoid cleavage dioxygenase-like enzyme
MEIVTNKIIDTTFFAWHFANGYVNKAGNVVFEACAYRDFDSFEGLKLDHLLNGNLKNAMNAKLTRFEIEIKTGAILSSE